MKPVDPLLASLLAIFLFGLFSLPWILFRLGYIKGLYLTPRIPPLIWWKGIYIWPAGIVFISPVLTTLVGLEGESGLELIGYMSLAGLLAAVVLILWTPGWAKPRWLCYLEDNYTYREIRRYIPVWRQMSQEWIKLMESEEGVDEAVRIAREKLKASEHRSSSV